MPEHVGFELSLSNNVVNWLSFFSVRELRQILYTFQLLHCEYLHMWTTVLSVGDCGCPYIFLSTYETSDPGRCWGYKPS